MGTNIYEPCTNPISNETFKTISFDEQAYLMQWTVQPKGYVPFEHIHHNQDEIFIIEKGEVRIVINGKDHIVKAGEKITVPRGQSHIAYNTQPLIFSACNSTQTKPLHKNSCWVQHYNNGHRQH